MGEMIDAGLLSERSQVIATYALCGFSNFASIAIAIGGIGALAPERKSEVAELGPARHGRRLARLLPDRRDRGAPGPVSQAAARALRTAGAEDSAQSS